MRTFTPRRALVALVCVTFAVLLSILGWRGLSFAHELVEGVDFGVVSTTSNPNVQLSVPEVARLTLLGAEAGEDTDSYYYGYNAAVGVVENNSSVEAPNDAADKTIRVTLSGTVHAATSGVTATLPVEGTSIDLAPGQASEATFNQATLAALDASDMYAFTQEVATELERLEHDMGATYPQEAASLDEASFEFAYVNFPAASSLTVIDQDGNRASTYEPGTTLYAVLANVPEGADVAVEWWLLDEAGNRVEVVGEGWEFEANELYVGLLPVATDQAELYLGELVPASAIAISEPQAYAVFYAEESLVEFCVGPAPTAGDVIEGRTVTAVDTSIEQLDGLASVKSKVTSVVVTDRMTFPAQSMDGYFQGFSALTSVDLDAMETSHVTSFANFYKGCTSLAEYDIATLDTTSATSLAGFFSGCTSLEAVEVSGLNTEAVSNISNFFYNCKKLADVDVSGWDTAAVTNFEGVFSGCATLAELDVSSWDTAAGTTFASLFNGCGALDELDLTEWDTSCATSMASMFAGCASLEELDLGSFDTSNVTNMSSMFNGASSLATVFASAETWTNESAKGSSNVFTNCAKIKGGNGTKFSTSFITGERAQVDRAGKEGYLTDASLEAAPFAMYSETDNSITIHSARVLPEVGAKYRNRVVTALVASIENLDELREAYGENVKTIKVQDKITFPYESMEGYFRDFPNATSIDVAYLSISKTANLNSLFEGCTSVKTLNLRNFSLNHAVTIERMFANCSALTAVYVTDETWNVANIAAANEVFLGCENIKGGNGTVFDAEVIGSERAVVDKALQEGYLTDSPLIPFAVYYNDSKAIRIYSAKTVPAVGSWYQTGWVTAVDDSIEELDEFTKYKKRATTIAVVNDTVFPGDTMDNWLNGYTKLQSADLAKLHGSVTSAYRMFYGCSKVATITFGNLSMKDATDLSYMFYGCKVLESLDLTGIAPSKVTNMSYMFRNCVKLTTLDLTGFSTQNVSNYTHAFYACSKLETIYASNETWTVRQGAVGTNMFYNCKKLMGGWGTKYSSKYKDTSRAWVDTAGQLGYLTDTSLEGPSFAVYSTTDNSVRIYAGVQPMPQVGDVFNERRVTAIDLTIEKLDSLKSYKTVATSLYVEDDIAFPSTTMANWLDGWNNLRTIDLARLSTKGVTNMSYVFRYCESVTTLDVSNFETKAVTTMRSMFSRCYSLKELDLTSFDVRKVTNIAYMFYLDGELTTVYANNTTWQLNSLSSSNRGYAMYRCYKIVGGCGTAYFSDSSTYKYCVVDKAGQPGFLTDPDQEISAYAVYTASDYTMRIYAYGTLPKVGEKIDGKTVTAIDGSLETLDGMKNVYTDVRYIEVVDSAVFPATSMQKWLEGWTSLRTANLAKLDVSAVTDMSYLFYKCTALTSIDVSGWNTSKVTTMAQMFRNCTSLVELDLSKFDTSRVTNMQHMFRQCTALTKVNLSSFNMKKVSLMGYMFRDCTVLKRVYATESLWQPPALSSSTSGARTSVFSGCSAITGGLGTTYKGSSDTYKYAVVDKVGQPGYLTDGTTLSAYAVYTASDSTVRFYKGDEMPEVGSKLDGKYVTAVDGSLDALDNFSSYKTTVRYVEVVDYMSLGSTITSMAEYFKGWTALKTVDMAKLDTSKITDMSYLFYNCSSVTTYNLTGWDTSNVSTMAYMFYNNAALTSLDLTTFVTTRLTNMNHMFYSSENLVTCDLSSFTTTKVTSMYNLFRGCSALTTVYATYGKWSVGLLSGYGDDGLFYGCKNIVGGRGTYYMGSDGTVEYAYIDTDTTEGYLTDKTLASKQFCVYSESDYALVFYGEGKMPTVGSTYKGRKVTAVDGSIKSPNLLNGIAKYKSSVKTIRFGEEVQFSYTYIDELFKSYTALTTVDFTNFDASNIVSAVSLFQGCTALTTVKLGEISFKSLRYASKMFYNCKALEIITADSSTFATPSLSSSNSASMFYGCAALVGGMGTAYNSNIQTSDRFVVDSEKNAGYVTDPNLTPASRAILTSNGVLTFAGAGPLLRPGSYYNGSYVTACDGTIAALEGLYGNYTAVTSIRMVDDIVFPGTSMKEYFSGWTGLTTANLTRLDISNVTNLSYAFSGCTALTTLDISTWTASNVTNTSYMFQNCKVLKSLNLEGFTPGKLTTISYMFSGCAALTTITVKSENFKTAYISSSNSTKAFYGCSSLVGGLGTAYDSSYVDVTRLAVDTSTVAGYLTDNSVEADARAILLNTGVLLFTGPGKFIAPGTYYSSSGYYGTVLAFDGSLKSLDGIEPSKTSVTSIVALDGAVMPYSSMAAMFKNYTKLTTVNLSKMDVSAVTSFSELFYGCTALTSVSLAGWNTSNVTNMSSMFYNCKLLTSLDLTSFSQTKLSYTESMFYGCAALATIKVDSETFGTKSISSSNSSKMFYGCTALLGGLGTPFDSSYVDKTRFVVDTANTLGYLTDPNLQSEAQFIVLANTTLVIAGKGTFIAPGSYYYYNGYNRLVTSSDGSIASLEGIASDKTKITQIVVASSGATIPVTSMKEMFSGFTALTSVSFKGLGTSNVTSWYKLFYGCTKLSSITFSGIDTSSISEMSYAFYNCKALTELDLAGLDFSALRYTTSAFYNCSSLFTIYADENWSPSNLSSYSDMFTGCTSLVGNLGTVFSSSYTGKTYACLDTSTQKGYFSPKGHVTDAPFAVMSSDYKVFILEPGVVPRPGTYKTIEGYSRYIAAVDGSIGKFDNFTDYAKVTYVSVVNEVQMPANASTGLFKDWAKLATVSLAKLDTSLVTSMYEWFSGCSVLASINLSSWNMSNVTNLGYFLSGCKALTSLDLTGLDFSALKTTNYMFNNCSALFTIYVDDNWSESKLTFSSGMFTGCTSLVGNLGTVHNTSYVDGTYARLDTSTQKGYFTPKDRMTDAPFAVMSSDYKVFILEPGVVPRPGDIKTIEGYSRTIAAVDGSIGSFDNFTSYAKVTYVSAVNEVQMPANTSTALFKGWSLLATVNLAKLDTSLVTSMYEWFSGCSVLTAANLSGWDTSNVTNMGYLFNNCKKLTSINLTGWNTSNVTAMHYMFYYNAVTTLDLSSFDTSSLKQTNYMFRYCTSLTTIYVNPNTWSMWSGINSSNMFTNCTSLVGEQGTKYSSSYTDLAYARVDEGTEKPGYLWSRIPETAESMVDVVVEEVAPSVDVVDDATLELEENLEVASNENEVQEVGDSDVETSDTAEKDAEVVAPGEDAGEDDTFIQESETTDGSGEAGFAEESAGIIDPEGLKAAEIDEATVEPQVEESELVTLSFEEVAAAVAVVPAGMLLAALRRRAA